MQLHHRMASRHRLAARAVIPKVFLPLHQLLMSGSMWAVLEVLLLVASMVAVLQQVLRLIVLVIPMALQGWEAVAVLLTFAFPMVLCCQG